MSEIKGQLLGLVLVLMVFGAVSGAIKKVFTDMKDTVVQTAGSVSSDLTGQTTMHF